MNILLFILILPLSIFIGCCQGNNSNSENGSSFTGKHRDTIKPNEDIKQEIPELRTLVNQYGESKILESFYCREGFTDVYQSIAERNPVLPNLNTYFQGLVTKERQELLKTINTQLTTKSDKQYIVKSVQQWCATDQLLNAVFIISGDQTFYVEELLYEIPETRPLFDEYITVEGQYWGSLSLQQSMELYYKSVKYISKLSPEKQLRFYSDYYSIARKKIKKE